MTSEATKDHIKSSFYLEICFLLDILFFLNLIKICKHNKHANFSYDEVLPYQNIDLRSYGQLWSLFM